MAAEPSLKHGSEFLAGYLGILSKCNIMTLIFTINKKLLLNLESLKIR